MPNSASERSGLVGVSRAASELLDDDPKQLRRDEHAAGSCRRQPRTAQSATVEQRTMAARAWAEMCGRLARPLRPRTRVRAKVRLRMTASRTTGSAGYLSSVGCGEKNSASGRAAVVLFRRVRSAIRFVYHDYEHRGIGRTIRKGTRRARSA